MTSFKKLMDLKTKNNAILKEEEIVNKVINYLTIRGWKKYSTNKSGGTDIIMINRDTPFHIEVKGNKGRIFEINKKQYRPNFYSSIGQLFIRKASAGKNAIYGLAYPLHEKYIDLIAMTLDPLKDFPVHTIFLVAKDNIYPISLVKKSSVSVTLQNIHFVYKKARIFNMGFCNNKKNRLKCEILYYTFKFYNHF